MSPALLPFPPFLSPRLASPRCPDDADGQTEADRQRKGWGEERKGEKRRKTTVEMKRERREMEMEEWRKESRVKRE